MGNPKATLILTWGSTAAANIPKACKHVNHLYSTVLFF